MTANQELLEKLEQDPDVDRFLVGPEDDPYLLRYRLVKHQHGGVYLHFIYRPDGDHFLHDHPWDFTTRIVSGSYSEMLVTGEEIRRPGDFVQHKAEDLHRIAHIHSGPVLTLVTVGAKRRDWGFRVEDKWVQWERFLQLKQTGQLPNGNG